MNEHIPVGTNRVRVVFPGEGHVVCELDLDRGTLQWPMGIHDIKELQTWFDRIVLMLPGEEQTIEMRLRAELATLISYARQLEESIREVALDLSRFKMPQEGWPGGLRGEE